jgi:hypothetical protein
MTWKKEAATFENVVSSVMTKTALWQAGCDCLWVLIVMGA